MSGEGSFAFATGVAAGSAYSVSIASQPTSPSQTCTVKNGSGTVTRGAVTTVVVICPSPWTQVVAGMTHTVGVRPDGTLWAWGWNAFGQLGDGTTTERTALVQVGTGTTWWSVAAGGSHTVAVKRDGTLWAWGCNDYGQLGDGSNPPQRAPEPIP